MPDPGDVIIVPFPGANATKRRPAVVLSTTVYHRHRPDMILGLLTSQVAKARTPTDYVLQDWKAAGLDTASAFRSYVVTVTYDDGHIAGHLSERDWRGVTEVFHRAVAPVPPAPGEA